MQFNSISAKEKLISMGIDDIPLMEYQPKQTCLAEDWFQTYKDIRKKFISSLTDSVEDISFMGLFEDEFINLVTGKSIPDNLSIRFRIPLLLGGSLDIDNMFLFKTFPHSIIIDKFISYQADAKTIFLPNPVKKVYVPSHLGGGGPGGNATDDRLGQMGAFLSGGR